MPGQSRSLPDDLFTFTTTDRAPLYTALIYAFGEANERLLTSLALDDVREHLSAVGWSGTLDDTELSAALQQLKDWRLVDAGQNHSEQYRTAQEYERRNLQYSLTRRGEAALSGHQAAVAALESSGGLQTAVLDAIAETLDRLALLTRRLPDSDTGPRTEATTEQRRLYAAFAELSGHLDAMRTGIRTFNSDLQRLLRADEVDEATFAEVKEATVRYLDDYVTRLDDRAARIRQAAGRVREAGLERLLQAALVGAELPPHVDAAERDAQWLDHAHTRWVGLEAWFAVQMARGETAGKPLTRQVHSALSGGEKAIALHLPLFAALAAHYEATPGAPRLILLDEVFVGIDTPNRGQIFGLLTELDFDLVLTSDHEWAAYPQIDGIAIHALASDDADDAVTSTRFVWTGTEMVEDPMTDGMLV